LHVVPVGLDQLPVEVLAHERRQHAVAPLCLERIEPAVIRARHAWLEPDAEQIHDRKHVIAEAAAVRVMGQDVDRTVVVHEPVEDMDRFAGGASDDLT
jgi:hypothetical protein